MPHWHSATLNPKGLLKRGRLTSNQEDLMQKMKPRCWLRIARIVAPAENFGREKSVIVRLQDDDRREIQPEVNLRGINLALLRRHIDANAPAMQFAWSVGWRHFFVRAIVAVLAATNRLRRLSGSHFVAFRTVMSLMPATTAQDVRDESRRRQEGHQSLEHGHGSESPWLRPDLTRLNGRFFRRESQSRGIPRHHRNNRQIRRENFCPLLEFLLKSDAVTLHRDGLALWRRRPRAGPRVRLTDYRLKSLCRHFKVHNDRPHDALADCIAEAEVDRTMLTSNEF